MVVIDLRRQVPVTVMMCGQEIDGHQQLLARPERCYAQRLQVPLGQRGEHIQIDFIRHEIRCKERRGKEALKCEYFSKSSR